MSDHNSESNKPHNARPKLPTPRPYHLTEPFQDRGLWCFWLTAEDDVLEWVSTLSCILQPSFGSPFQRRLRGRVMFAINPRYDHEETWLWLVDALESESKPVELNDTWETAIKEAQIQQRGD